YSKQLAMVKPKIQFTMKQPELGKKISELRKAKGLTQEELVEKCNLNVRTIQRIEAGEVTPRSYTVKALFEALDFSGIEERSQNESKFQNSTLVYLGIAAGIIYFFLSIFEIGYEIEFLEGKEAISRTAFSLIKVFTYFGYVLFMFAWVRLAGFFSNSFLKIAAWAMIGANLIWGLVDILALQTDYFNLGDYYMVKISSFGFFYILLGMSFTSFKNRYSFIPLIVGVLTIVAGVFLFSGIAAFLGLIPLTLGEIGQIGLMIYFITKIGGKSSPDSQIKVSEF
ncbi:MAG: helix-turn-helix transcriptional regulator, partial [Cyclobacteriaceae bacterium]|nr:helix-turn-helix transcriptional regulator [Cyclobacteriaceae bacterium]